MLNLGVDEADLCERVTNTSSVRPYSSIASIIILAANLPPLHGELKDFAPNKDFLEDAMPPINICINGSAVDAGIALTWALVHSAQKGLVTLDNDQSFFLLEVSLVSSLLWLTLSLSCLTFRRIRLRQHDWPS